jgi:hypothetical protein
VLTEHHGNTVEIPDAIGFRLGWHSIQVECKVSIADYRADAKKAGRRHDDTTGEFRQACERWYLVPDALAALIEPKSDWGLAAWDGRRVKVIRPALMVETMSVRQAEVVRLVSELRRYQSQGIRYKTMTELNRATKCNARVGLIVREEMRAAYKLGHDHGRDTTARMHEGWISIAARLLNRIRKVRRS